MEKSEQIIKQLEAELKEFTKKSENMDLNNVQHPAKWFARMSFYQAQAFKKVFERLDEIESGLPRSRR